MGDNRKIAIVDDHSIVREGLEMMLSPQYGSENLSGFANGKDLIKALREGATVFDLIILDIQLPDVMAFSLIPTILKLNSNQKILVFSMYPEEVMAESMFDIGAKGYISKEYSNSEVLQAIAKMLNEGKYISKNLKSIFSERYLNRDFYTNPLKALSKRELEVTMLLIQGRGVLEVSNTLDLNTSTVATYKSRVFEKLGVNNIVELYHKGVALGIV